MSGGVFINQESTTITPFLLLHLVLHDTSHNRWIETHIRCSSHPTPIPHLFFAQAIYLYIHCLFPGHMGFYAFTAGIHSPEVETPSCRTNPSESPRWIQNKMQAPIFSKFQLDEECYAWVSRVSAVFGLVPFRFE